LARQLQERFGHDVLSVPAFVIRERDGRRYITLAGAPGLLIPVRDLAGRIVALKIRHDDGTERSSRYSSMSSVRDGGPGPGAPVHIPMGIKSPACMVRVTEGELKADVAFSVSQLPTISAPGVSSWRKCLPVLHALGCETVRVAIDADAGDKPHVARALGELAHAVVSEGYALELERWPAEHKGIDDALAAGARIEILKGRAAQDAIAEILAESCAGETPRESSVLERLKEVLQDGAEALFRDDDLLRALAALAESEPSEFAVCRARLKSARIALRDVDKALAPLRQAIRRDRPALDVAGCYRISAGRIVRDILTREGPVEVPLATWTGRIVQEIIRDDGAERSVTFAVEGDLPDGTPLPRVEIPANEFSSMRWPMKYWGTRAVVLAGMGTADHVRCALQLLSGDVPRCTVYAHTGWREINGQWVYLHAGGAISTDGPVDSVGVALPPALCGFELPQPPEQPRLNDAIRASLRLLTLGPDCLMFPLVAAIGRATLGSCDFSVHISGRSGSFKTEVATLCQQHYGMAFHARNLAASWSSTGNALETVAFATKDALLAVDDFAPTGSTADVQRYHREADRLLRAQGNTAGRGRLAADGTPRPVKPPRGLILSTGEDVPRGQSLRARLFVLELSKGDIDASVLSNCQRDAAAGLYAQALAAYARWLAPRFASIRDGLRGEVLELRAKILAANVHPRTPDIVANLFAGLRHYLAFAAETGAITCAEQADLLRRGWEALAQAAASQAEHVEAADPVGQFLRLSSAALASGRAHVATPEGGAPDNSAAWGWRQQIAGHSELLPQGRRIGWIEDGNLYLEPEASYAEAQELARVQGDSMPVSAGALRRRLKDAGLLVSTEPGKLMTRRTLDGERRFVIHLRSAALSAQEKGESGERPATTDKPMATRPCSSPYSSGRETELDEHEGERDLEKAAAGPAPPVPPIPSGGGSRRGPHICDGGCRYPNHRRRWRSIHGVVNCGICTPPASPNLVDEWLDDPPQGLR
jgi:hypothetical protein